MSVTDVLEITQIEQSQSMKEVTANEATNAVALALADTLSLDLGVLTSPYTVATPDPALRCVRFACTGSPSATFVIIHPAKKHLFVLDNATGKSVTCKVTGLTGVTVPANDVRLLYCDGTDVTEVMAQPHDISAYYSGVLASNAVVLRNVAVRAWHLPTDAAGSAVSAATAATASTTLTLKKNGSSIGTAVVSASGTTAAFTVTATSFAALDVLTVTGPSSADATLANVALTLLGTR